MEERDKEGRMGRESEGEGEQGERVCEEKREWKDDMGMGLRGDLWVGCVIMCVVLGGVMCGDVHRQQLGCRGRESDRRGAEPADTAADAGSVR